MNDEIDLTKAHVTLADGTVWQVLDESGAFDELATAQAVVAHLEAQDAA